MALSYDVYVCCPAERIDAAAMRLRPFGQFMRAEMVKDLNPDVRFDCCRLVFKVETTLRVGVGQDLRSFYERELNADTRIRRFFREAYRCFTDGLVNDYDAILGIGVSPLHIYNACADLTPDKQRLLFEDER